MSMIIVEFCCRLINFLMHRPSLYFVRSSNLLHLRNDKLSIDDLNRKKLLLNQNIFYFSLQFNGRFSPWFGVELPHEPMVCDIENCLFGCGIRCHHHQPHEFQHGVHNFGFEVETIYSFPSTINDIFVILSHYLLYFLKLGLIPEHRALEEPNFEWFKCKLFLSYRINGSCKINFPLVANPLLLK